MLYPAHRQYRMALMGRTAQRLLQAERLAPALPRASQRILAHSARPAFDDWESWTIVEVGKEGVYRLRKCRWEREHADRGYRHLLEFDLNRLPEPQLIVQDCDIPANLWQDQCAALQALRMPVLLPPPPTVGLDGVTYELVTGTYMGNARFEWWHDGPVEWAPLCRWAEQFRAAMEEIAGGE